LNDGDIYINKHVPDMSSVQTTNEGAGSGFGANHIDLASLEFKPELHNFKGPSPVYVDRFILTSNFEEKCLIKMITRQTRVPEIGDKFSSRHG